MGKIVWKAVPWVVLAVVALVGYLAWQDRDRAYEQEHKAVLALSRAAAGQAERHAVVIDSLERDAAQRDSAAAEHVAEADSAAIEVVVVAGVVDSVIAQLPLAYQAPMRQAVAVERVVRESEVRSLRSALFESQYAAAALTSANRLLHMDVEALLTANTALRIESEALYAEAHPGLLSKLTRDPLQKLLIGGVLLAVVVVTK